jgi:hypothetical protein
LKELDGLTLTKYAEEIRAAVLEGVSGTAAKGKADVEGAVEVHSSPCGILNLNTADGSSTTLARSSPISMLG